jgi:hypothetical protein
MSKFELAEAAGVSRETMRRWLKQEEKFLRANRISVYAKVLPPKVVAHLCQVYGISV